MISLETQVVILGDLITVKPWDDTKLPADLRHFLSTTLVVKQSPRQEAKVRSGTPLSSLDKNVFKGRFQELLHKYELVEVWNEALRQAVLVADRQVTHYIQVSGYPLTCEKSTLAWTVTGLKKEIFRESSTEKFSRLYDQKNIIIDRKTLKPKVASQKLKKFRDRLVAEEHRIFNQAFRRWISASPDEKRIEVFTAILRSGHPVRRALDNLLMKERSQDLLTAFSSDCSSATSTETIAILSTALISRCLPKNLVFTSTRHRLENFVRKYMQTRIDYGSMELLETSLRGLSKKPKWLRRFGLNNHALFLQCLCALLVKLVVLKIHAVFEVASRAASPKVPEYAPRWSVSVKRRDILRSLVEKNLQPTDDPAQGTILALPKASPFEYRPVFKYIRQKPCPSVTLRSYLQCLKSDSQAKLQAPICAINATLALQRLSELRQKGKLFFVKGDVRDCYGSVDLDLMEKSLRDNWPTSNRAWEFVQFDLPLRPGNHKKKCLHLFEDRLFKRPLCDGRLSVLIPTGKLSVWEPQDELNSIVRWLNNIVVEVGDSGYRFRKAVPQGAILSSLIADLYLALHIDQLFARFKDDLLVFRTMDDYLAVSTSRETAQRCLQIFKNETLHSGLTFSESKFLTNWPADEDDSEDFVPSPFSYCGEELHPVSGHFLFPPDYRMFFHRARCYRKNLHGRPIEKAFKYLLTSSYWGYPMGLFSYDGKNLPILFRNIFEAAVDHALRFRSYVDDSNIVTMSLLRFIRIHRLVFLRYVRTAVFKHSMGSLVVSRRSLLFLHVKAFKKVLSWNKRRYQNLLEEIEKHFKDDMNIKSLRHEEILHIASRDF